MTLKSESQYFIVFSLFFSFFSFLSCFFLFKVLNKDADESFYHTLAKWCGGRCSLIWFRVLPLFLFFFISSTFMKIGNFLIISSEKKVLLNVKSCNWRKKLTIVKQPCDLTFLELNVSVSPKALGQGQDIYVLKNARSISHIVVHKAKYWIKKDREKLHKSLIIFWHIVNSKYNSCRNKKKKYYLWMYQ